jgi:DNA recombination protein RmuC
MDSILLAIVTLLFGLVVGSILGWFLAARPVAELRNSLTKADEEAKARETSLKQMTVDLVGAMERLKTFDDTVNGYIAIRDERDSLKSKVATLEANAANFEEKQALILQSQELMKKEFEAAGAKVLGEAQEAFLQRAAERFTVSEEKNEARIKALLEPVSQTIASHQAQVSKMEKERIEGFSSIDTLMKSVRDGQERVLDGANRISTSIRGATKMVGDWGELQFLNLLESCGLSSRTDFECQVSVKGSDGILRPDAIVNIPGGRKLVVDVKNVFNTYAAANEATNEEERLELLKGHAREIRGHIDELSSKRYQDYVDGSADFVVMFIPGEHVLYTAVSMDSGLLNYALKKNVVLSSPLNFMSIALTVVTIWRQADAQADADEITRLGKELYDRLGVVAGHISNLRKSLHSTNQHFDSLVGSFDTNLRRTGERFEKLAVDTSAKELHDAPPLNITPRRLSNFSDSDEPANDEAAE